MIVGILRKVYSYPLSKYLCAIGVTVGLAYFNLSNVLSKDKNSSFNLNQTGVILLLGSLLFDGINNSEADMIKKKGKMPSAFILMITHNCVGALISIAKILYDLSVLENLTLSSWFEMSLLGLSGAIGQCFIFLTINYFDCFILTTIATVRKFFSILTSVILFGHILTGHHYFGISIVFASLSVDIALSELNRRNNMKQSKSKKVKSN